MLEQNCSPKSQFFPTKASSTAHHGFGVWFGVFGCDVFWGFLKVCFLSVGGCVFCLSFGLFSFSPKLFSKEGFFLLVQDDKYIVHSILTPEATESTSSQPTHSSPAYC